MNIKKYILNIGIAVIALFGLFSGAQIASAVSDLSGNAWSGNIGWITFNCLSTSTCGASNSTAYKVILNDQNKLDGYAWSDNIGWIRFDPNLSSCPGGSSAAVCAPRVIYSGAPADKYTLYGFAKAVSGNGSTSVAGFSGFIDLNGLNTGAAVGGSRKMLANSYAWGSDLIGWIDMSDVSFGPPSWSPALTVNLTANKQTLSLANSEASRVLISYSATPVPGGNALTCNRTKTVDGVLSPNTTWNSWNVTNTAAVSDSRYYDLKDQPYTTTYTIQCTNSLNGQTASASIVVGFAPEITLASSTPQVPYYYQFNAPVKNPITLSWTAKHSNFCTAKKVVNGSDVSDPVWTGTIWTGNSSLAAVSGTKAVTYDGSSDVTYVITCVGARPDLISSKSVTVTIAKPSMTITATATVPSNNTNPVSAVALPSGSTTQTAANQVLLTWNMTNFQYSGGVSCNGMKKVSGIYTTGAYDFLNIWGFGYTKTPPSIVYGKYGSSNPYVSPTYTAKSQYATAGPADAEYIITCINNATRETATASVFVPVTGLNAIPVPSITSFTATPSSFTASSGVSEFSWTAVNVSSCKLDRISPTNYSVSSSLPIVGKELDTVNVNSTYQLSCTNGINTVSKSVNVSVNAPSGSGPTVTLNATVSPVSTANRSTRLYWTSSSTATSCRLTRSSDGTQLYPPLPAVYGSVTNNNATNGISTSVLGSEDTYVVDCRDAFSQSGFASRNIKVNPPMPAVVSTLSVNPPTTGVSTGTSKTVSWTVSNATSCTKDKTSGTNPDSNWTGALSAAELSAGSGSSVVVMGPANTTETYRLSCTNPDNVTPVVRTVSVGVVAAPIPPVITSFAPVPPIVPPATKFTENSVVSLNWVSTPAGNSCNIDKTSPTVANNIASGGSNGSSNPITIGNKDETYRLTCTRNSLIDTRDLTLVVDPLTKKIKVIER